MLVQRVVTALILLPLLLALVWYAPTPWLYAVLALVGMLMAWEWTGLMSWAERGRRWAYTAVCGLLLALAWFVPGRESLLPWLLGVAVLWWLFAISLFPRFPDNIGKQQTSGLPMALLGLLLTVSTLLALAALHAMGPLKLLFFLFIVFAADTGAYLAGRNFGKRKLAPNISPGKTVEGAVGGLLLTAAWAMTAGLYVFAPSGNQVWLLLLLTVVVAAISIVGDLTESMFKRIAGIKDSGNILPGHGGILDRVDSILAGAPVMVLGLYLTGL
ncbi:phosphatidate cytidylyltransferase [Solimonas sp. K1W22B-7]|uniref:phosphatidate cytidylyltransferase n=1 Tax=Solimonas sp. K1W22B-7 TaxID=2303331 RepID=UPI000E330ADF|nr:phosphatidate cytidylyltransferase [Solimonas sp. K1W22B-7]AXQ28978.1 phosphatidate cytidylyltransferase [Solimonas sp. K1W22B-7]